MTPPLLADATTLVDSEPASSPHLRFDAAGSIAGRRGGVVHLRTSPCSGDVRSVQRILRATGFFSDEEISVAGQIVAERLRDGPSSEYAMVFADDDSGVTVGYVCFGRIVFTRSSHDVYWLAVDPDAQGAGVGRRLLREAELAAASAGATQVFIETAGREQYAPTHRFYERLGYREAARLRDFYAPGDDKVVFAKQVG